MVEITNLIGSLGFPIVACIYMAKMLKDERDRHEEEVWRLTQALNDNTQILTELKTLFESMRGGN